LDNNNNDTIINPESRLLFLSALSAETMANVPYSYIDSTVTMRNHTSHYTEASLIQKLEDLGIGRPSTFASLVDTIQTRGYVKHTDIKGTKMKCEEFVLRDAVIESKISEKIFGQEKSKLAIQPIGRVTMEFLIQHFEQLFSYDYTKQMEQDLDEIQDTTESWTSICRKCYLEIQDLSKQLIESKTGKCSAYKIDEENELIIQPFGASIKHTSNETGEISYLPARKDLDIDLAKVNDYQVEDIVAFKKTTLGEYCGMPVTLHNGKYGPYVRWGDKTQSLGDTSVQDITLEDIIPILDTTRSPPPPKNAAILRPITTEMSIRSGKFGPYVYYKTDQMKKPAFISLKKFKQDPITCNLETLTQWIHMQPQFNV
jgi:DNA topoisomerase-1